MDDLSAHGTLAGDAAPVGAGALIELIERLKSRGYRFITPAPETHARVIARPDKRIAATLRDVFGWSLPFPSGLLPDALLGALRSCGALGERGGLFLSALRASTLGDDLYLHSAFPTEAKDAVFFGPDTYRFAAFIEQELRGRPRGGVMAEPGTGAGAGAVVAARLVRPDRLLLSDVNPEALRLARANLAAAGVEAELTCGHGLDGLAAPFDLVVANPPYIADDGGRTYSDGGGMHGAQLSLDWTLEAAEKLAVGGLLLLYTGSAIVEGRDLFREAVEARLDPGRFDIRYRELDPDVFGEQLASPAYRDVERIAAVGLRVERIKG